MTEGMMAILATVIIAFGGAIWAVAQMMMAQLEKQIRLMDQGICAKLEDMEKARRLATEQWRALFNDLRRQHRDIAARLDHLEERVHAVEHTLTQCQNCRLLPSDLPE